MLRSVAQEMRAPRLDFAEGAWPGGDDLGALIRAYGFVHLRGFYRNDPAFLAYVEELAWCAGALMRAHGVAPAGGDLETRLNALRAHDPELARRLYLIGTQPMQLASGNAWKFSARATALARAVFGADAHLATPGAGDSLLGHHPGEANRKYILPVHQDYPYLLQSERMLTFWTPMSEPHADLGGLTVWPTSHLAGPLPAHPDRYGHLEAELAESADYPEVHIADWNFGDLVLMHGSLLHRGDHNLSPARTRVVQLFRYTDLNDPIAVNTAWASRAYPRPNTMYDEVRPLYRRRAS